MVLMAARGLITPMPECAIFADTGAEPASVYKHLEWLMSPGLLPFPVRIVTVGNLRDVLLAFTRGEGGRGAHARPPFFVQNADGSRGMLRRQCTRDYKVDPINNEISRIIGRGKHKRWPKKPVVEQWIGISTDEASRMKDSTIPAIRMRYPLIELGMSRKDCLKWHEATGYPQPPKSACTFCPYRHDDQWRSLRDNDPEGFAEAITVDNALRSGVKWPGIDGSLFVHDSLTPLEDVDLRTNAEKGLPEPAYQPNLFENECEGMCGV